MAAAASNFLSVQQFDELYEREKPYYEYWFGEAIQKPIPLPELFAQVDKMSA
jgi:hypothetical protein